MAPRANVTGAGAAHLRILERAGGVVRVADSPAALADVRAAIEGATVVVDALFGVGLDRAVEGHFACVIAVINRVAHRLALDIPSGLDTDTGRVLGIAVEAHRTVTMAARKVALASSPGFAHCGRVAVAEIGVPPAVLAAQGIRVGLEIPAIALGSGDFAYLFRSFRGKTTLPTDDH